MVTVSGTVTAVIDISVEILSDLQASRFLKMSNVVVRGTFSVLDIKHTYILF